MGAGEQILKAAWCGTKYVKGHREKKGGEGLKVLSAVGNHGLC